MHSGFLSGHVSVWNIARCPLRFEAKLVRPEQGARKKLDCNWRTSRGTADRAPADGHLPLLPPKTPFGEFFAAFLVRKCDFCPSIRHDEGKKAAKTKKCDTKTQKLAFFKRENHVDGAENALSDQKQTKILTEKKKRALLGTQVFTDPCSRTGLAGVCKAPATKFTNNGRERDAFTRLGIPALHRHEVQPPTAKDIAGSTNHPKRLTRETRHACSRAALAHDADANTHRARAAQGEGHGCSQAIGTPIAHAKGHPRMTQAIPAKPPGK